MRTDAQLAHEAAEGSESGFGELVRRHQGTVRGMARRLTGSAAEGDDIAQMAFLKGWRGISSFGGGAFRSWICKIAYREFLQARRRQRPEVAFDENVHAIAFDRTAEFAGERIDLSRALATLPEAQRICVTLCVAAGLSHSEAADATEWPLGTVKSHVQPGVAALRARLASEDVA